MSIEAELCLPAGAEVDLLETWRGAGEWVPVKSVGWPVRGLSFGNLLVDWLLGAICVPPCKSEVCFLDERVSDLSVDCLCGEWSVLDKSEC